jgi:phage shock protein PspC (stress-responsive transcriptional regulator)
MNTQDSRPGPEPGPSPGAPGAPHTAPATEFFDRIRGLGVVRPAEGRWAAGVCAGLARRWALDPLLVRGLFVAGALVTGIGLGVYGLLWLFLPHPDGRIHAQQVLHGVVTAGFTGSILLVLFDFPLSNGAWFGWHSGGPWGVQPFGGLAFLAILGFGVWWLLTRDRSRTAGGDGTGGAGAVPGTGAGPVAGPGEYGAGPGAGPGEYGAGPEAPAYGTPEPVVAARRSPSLHKPLHALTLTTLGVAVLAAGGILAWDRAIGHVPAPAGVVATAVALGVIALGIVLAGALGRRAGGLAPIAVLLAIVSVNGAAWHDTTHSVGREVTWTPVSTAASEYNLGAGRAVLDLTSAELTTRATAVSPVTIPVSVGAGELVVLVPSGTTTEVNASVGLGAVTDGVIHNNDRGGAGLHQTETYGSGGTAIRVDAKIGFGRIWIAPQGTKVTG